MNWWLQFSEVVRNLGLVAAGGIGLWLAWLRVRAATLQADAALKQSEVANEQAKLARREHVAELFNQAVGQLSDEKLEVRLAAVYTLREVSADFPDLTRAVVELLTTYLREKRTDYGEEQPPVDIQEIMAVILARSGEQK
ncbi:MAG: hypothetical protein ACRCUE_20025 [Bosea sp. (in: a-proteobacteria)]